MRIFIWVNFIMLCIGTIARSILISISEHPRTTTYKKGEDIFYLLLGIGMAIWAGILLFM